jgi:hypothetical protein
VHSASSEFAGRVDHGRWVLAAEYALADGVARPLRRGSASPCTRGTGPPVPPPELLPLEEHALTAATVTTTRAARTTRIFLLHQLLLNSCLCHRETSKIEPERLPSVRETCRSARIRKETRLSRGPPSCGPRSTSAGLAPCGLLAVKTNGEGVSVQTSRKGREIDKWYSGKAHHPAGNVQALAAPGGVPLWVPDILPGRRKPQCIPCALQRSA